MSDLESSINEEDVARASIKQICISAAEAYDKLTNFDPDVDKWTNHLDRPKAGELIFFYSTQENELGK